MKRKSSSKYSAGMGIGIGTGLAIITYLVLAIAVTALVLNERIKEDTIKNLVPFLTLIATTVGAVSACKLSKNKIAVVSVSTALLFLLVLVATGIFFFEGGFYNLWTSLASIVFGCVISCAICIREKKGSRKRKRAYS